MDNAEFVDQQKMVMQRMAELERRVAKLEEPLAMPPEELQPSQWDAEKPPGVYDPDEVVREINSYREGKLPRGKYAGRTHEEVVQADPPYVLWLHRENKATGLGFTTEHVEKARQAPKPPSRYR